MSRISTYQENRCGGTQNEEKEERGIKIKRRGVSFAGCGFMGMYHAGVGQAIQDHCPQYINNLDNMYGASAGSIVVVFGSCGIPAREGYKFIKELYDKAHSNSWLGRFSCLHPRFDLIKNVREFLERVLPSDAHRRCRGRVGVSLTIVPSLKNWIVSDFNTRAELIQAVICSCFIPLYCGVKLPKFRGKYCCDGGISHNMPYSSDPQVITVSPFSGECDICPSSDNESYYQTYLMKQTVHVSVDNIYRGIGALIFLPWAEMEGLFQQGYDDTLVFLKKEGVKTIVPPLLETAAGDSLSIDEATSDYYSLQPTPNHSRHSSSVTELSSPPPFSPSPSSFVWSFSLYSSALYTHPPQVLLSVGKEVWSKLSIRWKRFLHKLSMNSTAGTVYQHDNGKHFFLSSPPQIIIS